MAEYKSKFRNAGKGVVGVVTIGLDGRPKGIPVSPNDFVWLTEEEQVLTANAPRNPEDNPFTNGSLQLEVRGSEANTARPIGDEQEPAAPVASPAAEEPEVPEEEHEEIEEVQPPAADPPPPPEPETGAGDPPQGEPPEGVRAEHEEIEEPVTPAEPEPPKPAPVPAAKPPRPKAPAAG